MRAMVLHEPKPVEERPLEQANEVLLRLKQGKVQGAAVLTM